jgi:hypothetical protein
MSQPLLELVWSNERHMPPPTKKDKSDKSKVDWSPWTPLLAIIGSAVISVATTVTLFLYLYSRLGGLETSLANLTGRLEPIFNQYYQPFKKIAVEKGYPEDGLELIPVSLATPRYERVGPPRIEYKGKNGDIVYHVTYELIETTKDHLTFNLNGNVGTTEFKDVKLIVPLKLNDPIELTSVIRVRGLPRIFIEVIALPSKEIGDTVILATGPKILKA